MNRIVIIGGPHTGKTTLAAQLGKALGIVNVRSTDSLISLGWSEASQAASFWFSDGGKWIVEGVAAPRALRKWLSANPRKELDGVHIICLWKPFDALTKGQQGMATGVRTVWDELVGELKFRGATVHEDYKFSEVSAPAIATSSTGAVIAQATSIDRFTDPELEADLAYLSAEELATLDMLLRTANDRWCPHSPTPRQKLFLELTSLDAFYGGAAGGGKTDALLMAALQYVDVPGYSALLLMKTFADLSKPGALMDRAHRWLAGSGAEWKGDKKRWEFPNVAGPPATLDFGYLQTDQVKYNYRTAEYQFIGFDELTRFLEKTFTYMFSRLRRLEVARHIPIRMRSASNPAQPGEPGMQWVEARYIPEDFDPEYEATIQPRILTKDGINQQDGKRITRMFVFARLEDNPYLDADEYELSLGELDPITWAQLRKGDWKIKHRGDIYFSFDPKYIFVPWSRWKKVFEVAHIPNHWLLAVSQDQGTSDGHIGATGWFATAAKNSPIQDLVAMYRPFTAIEMAATEVGDAMLTLMGAIPEPKEKPNQEEHITADGYGGLAEYSRVKTWLNSHEAKSERLEYAKMKPIIPFTSWTAGPNIGIAQVRDYIRVIERDKPNPFFEDLGLMGRTRFVCVVPDEDWPRRRQDSPWARVEAEFVAYHYKQLKSGEPTTSATNVPDARFNDYMDMIKAAAFDSFPRPKPLSKEEKIEEQLADEIKAVNIPLIENTEDQSRALLARQVWSKEIQEREEEERRSRGRRGGRRVIIPHRPRVPVKR